MRHKTDDSLHCNSVYLNLVSSNEAFLKEKETNVVGRHRDCAKNSRRKYFMLQDSINYCLTFIQFVHLTTFS